jgi:hypothetical protein
MEISKVLGCGVDGAEGGDLRQPLQKEVPFFF